MTWRATGFAAALLAEGSLRELLLDGQTLVLARNGGVLSVLDGTCPHAGGFLALGRLADGEIHCPEHGARFDARSGAVRADPDGVEPPQGAVEALRTYPVRIVDGMVEIDL